MCLGMALCLAMSLVACGHKKNDGADTLDKATVKHEDSEWVKDLEPVKHREWETVSSNYYKDVVVDGENYYEVQPVGEEAIQVPVAETVIYGIEETPCQVEKITAEVNGEAMTQYRLHIVLEGDL